MHIVCVVGRILEMASQGSHILVSQNTFLGNALKRFCRCKIPRQLILRSEDYQGKLDSLR